MREGKKLIFELSTPGRVGFSLPEDGFTGVEIDSYLDPDLLRKKEPNLPEVSEVDVVRHFTSLSRRNFGVDSGFYPLGSCTMKYNPKVNEDVSRYQGFALSHPYQPEETVQGNLKLLYKMDQMLQEITGMDRFSFQPAAGAHGELTGLMIIKAYHLHNGDKNRNEVIVPDSAHGTNPASAAMCGFKVVEVKSNENGLVDLKALKKAVSEKTAALMLTNPNTLGLFETDIIEIAEIVHNAGGLLYYDGANANAILGKARPGDMGFDVLHLNLHKTFGTPHGGGGPGSGPVGVKEKLIPFLPVPLIEKAEGKEYYYMDFDRPESIGKVKACYGNFTVIVKAFAYILAMGAEGLRLASEDAVLNANYLKEILKEYYELPYDRVCKHEFVLSGVKQKKQGASTLDIAKRLIDYKYHPPTIYFPLIVKEALMIEPTETESKETLDAFAEAMINIAREITEDPDKVTKAPLTTVVGRLDEVTAARRPILRWKSEN
ncbi:glycine dehydrogenase (aminomethyl-transferring) [Anoxybacter fermentans]|uniref:Probable glycine dehydrogenase (decarboxylating) subunit 2 n=1 Tax=Anoxybacter fermentans TaxID=1323375 RepID=A0A3S9SX42_9FIRM|nr:aminomethyl-transferring glycine dehydrogenase subunit GcvPB [Anoxybacter fermentans]AZR72903.1 glycine dehydrogenase (aminomethyl-transferring) [Anoxybacter fermentans]